MVYFWEGLFREDRGYMPGVLLTGGCALNVKVSALQAFLFLLSLATAQAPILFLCGW